MKKRFYIFFMIVLVAVFVTSIIYIIMNYTEDKKQNTVFEELENIVTEEQEDKNKEQKDESINLMELYEINNDFIGWLKILNTNISYPVMQTDSNRKDY